MDKKELMDNLGTARAYILRQMSRVRKNARTGRDEPFKMSITTSEKLNSNESECSYDNYYGIEVNVGCKNIVEAKDDESFSDYDMMVPLVAMFHETYGHANHIIHQSQKDDTTSKVILLNYMACRTADDYYLYEKKKDIDGKPVFDYKNYYNQPHEIAAQYAGIKYAYKYCTQAFGKEKADELICNYVNTRIANESEFISLKDGKPYENVEDILAQFEDTFKEKVYKHREVPLTAFKEHERLNKDTGKMEIVRQPLDEHFREHPSIKNEGLVKLCSNGMAQDLMLASVYLFREDRNGVVVNNMPALKDARSIDKAFAFADKPQWMKQKDRDASLSDLVVSEKAEVSKDELQL